MSGASNLGGNVVPKTGPDFDRKVSTFAPQRPSASLAIPTETQAQDVNEAFRQEWQAIVGSLHAADQARGDNLPVADSLRAAGAPVSIQKPATNAADESEEIQDTVERASDELVAETASTAESITTRPPTIPKTLPVHAGVHADPDRLLPKWRAKDSASHWTQSSLTSDQLDSQKGPNIQTAPAPYFELRIVQPSTLKPATSLITAQTPPARSFAREFTNRRGASSGDKAGLAASDIASVSSSVMGRRFTGTTEDGSSSEEQTAFGIDASHVSAKRTDEPVDGPSEYLSSHEPTSIVEQATPSMPDRSSPRLPLNGGSTAVLANNGSTAARQATELTLNQEGKISQPSIGLLRSSAVRHDQAGIVESPLYSKAKTAAAPFTLNPQGSDASSSAFGQARGAPLPASSTAWTPTLTGHEAAGVTPGKTASVQETFAAMDVGVNDGSARWIVADSHRAEAGFQDPALGWISVRAQASATGIHAAVMPSSGTAAEVLSGHLAGLNAHMANHYEHMNAVTLSVPETGWNSLGAGRDMAHGNDRGASQDNRQQAQENPAPRMSESARQFTDGLQDERAMSELPVFTTDVSLQEHHFSVVV